MAFLAFRKSAIGCPRKLSALRAEVDVPAQISAGAFSCFALHVLKSTPLRCPGVCFRGALTNYSAADFPLSGTCVACSLTTGHTGANTAL